MHSCGIEDAMEMNMEESCCSNQTESIDGQDELNIQFVSFDLIQYNFIIPITFVLINLLPEVASEVITYPPYQPPQLVYDLQVLGQVFII